MRKPLAARIILVRRLREAAALVTRMDQWMANGLKLKKSSMAERQILQDAIRVGFINDSSFAKPAAALRAFAGEQVASAGVRAQHLAGRRDFEAFGHGFFGFDAFGSSHRFNFCSKRAGNIGTGLHRGKL